MKNNLLMYPNEPSDKDLKNLMKDVARDVKKRATISRKKMQKKIKQEIDLAFEKNQNAL